MLAAAPRLNELHVGDTYSESELDAARKVFAGQYFESRGGFVVGDEATQPYPSWFDLTLGPANQRKTLELLRSGDD